VRVVSATNQPLEAQAEQGVFRSDLLHRLNALTLRIPPLRERGGDVLLLARRFLAQHGRDYARPLRGFAQDALDAMSTHAWPGNVRELENRIRRAALLAEGPLVGAADLELIQGEPAGPRALDLRVVRRRAERDAIEDAMAQGGNVARAARLLGVSRPTLYGLLDAHGLSPRGEPERPDVAPTP
jgi:two-component system NtrC family response regulator